MITLNFKKLHTDVYITEDGIEIPRELILGNKHEFNEPEHLTGWVQLPVSIISNGDVRLVGISYRNVVEDDNVGAVLGTPEETGELIPENTRVAGQSRPRPFGPVPGMTTFGSQEWIDQPEGFQLLNPPELEKEKYFAAKPLDELQESGIEEDAAFPSDGEIGFLEEGESGEGKVFYKGKEIPKGQPILIGQEDSEEVTDTLWGGSAKPLEDFSKDDAAFFAETQDSLALIDEEEGPDPDFYKAQGNMDDGVLWGAAAVLHVLGLQPRPNKNGSIHRWYHPAFGDDKPENHLLFDLETDSMDTIGFKLFRLGARLGTRALKLQVQNALEQH